MLYPVFKGEKERKDSRHTLFTVQSDNNKGEYRLRFVPGQ